MSGGWGLSSSHAPEVPLFLGEGTGLGGEGGHLPPQPSPKTARAESAGTPQRASGKTRRGHECPSEGQTTLSSFLQGDRSSPSTASTRSGAGPKDLGTIPLPVVTDKCILWPGSARWLHVL